MSSEVVPMDSPEKKPRTKLVNMNEIDLESTELGYVTAINPTTRTFFCQLTKFTNDELIEFNRKINNHCELIYKYRKDNNDLTRAVPKKVHRGDIVCAKYSFDNCWYRAIVLNYDKATRKCALLFVDYGNMENNYDHNELVEVRPDEINCIERCPFGLTCFIKDLDQLTTKKVKVLLETLISNYVMVRIKDRQTSLQWLVELPENAHNASFLVIYKSGLENDDIEMGREESMHSGKKRHRTESYVSSTGSGQSSQEESQQSKSRPPLPKLYGPGRPPFH